MMHLRLRENERSLFENLPDSLRDGWLTEEEARWYEDSPHALQTRLSLLRSHVPSITSLKKNLQSASTEMEIITALRSFDIHAFSHDELLDVFFILGPNTVSEWIFESLLHVKTDDDLLNIAALSEVRHTLLSSFCSK
jgi:hypothetical protein